MNAMKTLVIVGAWLCAATVCSAQSTATEIAYDVGLDPLGMAIAGLEGQEALDALNQMSAASTLQDTLANQISSADAIMASITALRASLFERYSETDAFELAAAEASLAVALSEIEETRAAIRLVGLAGLTEGQIQNAQTCLATRAYSVMPKHRLLTLTASQWLELESACRAIAIADATGDPLDPAAAAVLEDYSLDSEVLDAQLNYSTFMSPIESAFSIAEPE